MKPSDFFLSRRHFIGFFVPGVLWLAAGAWIFGVEPMKWYQHASARELILCGLASYFVGYVIQTATFSIIYKTWRAWIPRRAEAAGGSDEITTKLKDAARQAARLDPQWRRLEATGVHDLAHFCKWRAATENPLREAEFSEFEDEINFAISVGVVLFVFAIVAFTGIHSEKPPGRGLSTLIFILGCYMLWRFRYLKRIEERAWYSAFLLLQPNASADDPEADHYCHPDTEEE